MRTVLALIAICVCSIATANEFDKQMIKLAEQMIEQGFTYQPLNPSFKGFDDNFLHHGLIMCGGEKASETPFIVGCLSKVDNKSIVKSWPLYVKETLHLLDIHAENIVIKDVVKGDNHVLVGPLAVITFTYTIKP
ncbi:hypothetical protein [Neptuniibacter sp.]|uniref:hypothetical protein n=1 Tax=Neptuniibacter sp. TaxID=1962643 RepID=UPI003B5BAF2F